MPPGIAVPVGLAVLGMISQNVQNKAAAQQNTNQQNASVHNAHAAYQAAQQQLQNFMSTNPAPFSGASIARPAAYGAGGVPQPQAAPQAPGATAPMRVQPPAANGAPPVNPMLLRALYAHLMQQQRQRAMQPQPVAGVM